MRGSISRSARAQLAPAKPPPTMTMRGAACAMAARDHAAAAAPATPHRICRRFLLGADDHPVPYSLRRVPRGDCRYFVVRKALGDAPHDGCGTRPMAERRHGRDDVGRIAAAERFGRGIGAALWMAVRAGRDTRRREQTAPALAAGTVIESASNMRVIVIAREFIIFPSPLWGGVRGGGSGGDGEALTIFCERHCRVTSRPPTPPSPTGGRERFGRRV